MSSTQPLRMTFGRLCRDTRLLLGISQSELAAAAGVSRPYITSVETGQANPSFDVVERIAPALGLELRLVGEPPILIDPLGQRDLVHARCSGYVDRRLHRAGWLTHREVTIVGGRTRGWIDLLAFDPRRRILVVIEVKTWLDDLGAIERQLDWYVREAPHVARARGLRPVRTIGWLLVLATKASDVAVRRNRDALDRRMPARARDMRALLAGGDAPLADGIALIDPCSRRRDWLMPTQLDGRRSKAPYLDLAAARQRMSA